MRRILIDRARLRNAGKRGGGLVREELPADWPAPEAGEGELLDLDEALTLLEKHDAKAARLVKLRYFAGLSHQDAADALGISRGAADRLWVLARTWLLRQMSK